MVRELTAKHVENQDSIFFVINPFVGEKLYGGSDVNNGLALQEPYPHLAVIDPKQYCYEDNEMIIGQDV